MEVKQGKSAATRTLIPKTMQANTQARPQSH